MSPQRVRRTRGAPAAEATLQRCARASRPGPRACTRHSRNCTRLSPCKPKSCPAEQRHEPEAFLKCEQRLTNKLRSSTYKSTRQSQPADWFHSLPFQQFQALLTLFSKSFSSFPHGTCLLSVSSLYLALDEIYHPLYAPIPRNATLRACAVHGGLQVKHRILTHVDALFQEAYTCASVGNTSRGYNPRPRPQFPSRAHPCSFAITKGILFSSFSSAYLYA